MRYAQRTSVRLALFALLATILVWPLLESAAWLNEFRDAQVMEMHAHAAVTAVRRYGELPLWNPWYCGGIYGLGTPQSRFATPFFFFDLLLGPERAELLLVFVFTVLGMEGTYRWLSVRVSDASAALRIAPVFALSGQFAVAYFRGWTNFFGFELVPFVLYGIAIAARGRTAGIVVAAVAFATLLGFGGTFAAPLVAVAAVVEAVRSILEQPRAKRLRALVMLGITASFLVTLSAVRLLPLAETLAAAPRVMAGMPGNGPLDILWSLVRPLSVNHGDVENAGTFYVGIGFLLVMALGGSDRKSIAPLVCLIVFTWLSGGYARTLAFFGFLRELPVFSALRYPERFLWLSILFASEPAAHALMRIPRLGEGKRFRIGASVVMTLAVLSSVYGEVTAFSRVGSERILGTLTEREGPFHQSRGNRWLAAHFTGLNEGSLSCWETYPVTMSPKLRADLRAEEWVLRGVANRVAWSPNRITVHVALPEPGRLWINQNWHPGWHASAGTVVSDDGLLAVDLPAGERDVTVSFGPRSALAGFLVSLAAFGSLAGFLLTRRRRLPLHRGLAVGTFVLVLLPWLVFAACLATWNEPRFPPPRENNANGSPAIVLRVPADAKPVEVQFTMPIAVEGVSVSALDARSNAIVDVYLRRQGPIDREAAIFLRAKRRGGGERTIMHQIVGGSFYLSAAPAGALVHDVFGINLEQPGTYDLLLGLANTTAKVGTFTVP